MTGQLLQAKTSRGNRCRGTPAHAASNPRRTVWLRAHLVKAHRVDQQRNIQAGNGQIRYD